MAQRRLHGLQRVLGVNALFSTAYGNVGSSIYYALGLVAALALGLTPVVFILAGALFYCTATTYAEATAMYPEAGGASLFVRRAYNEFWSFFTAWAQMLNYVITIAISAFFAAHYAGGVFWAPLKESPGDVALAAIIIGLLAVINVRGASEAVGVNIVLAVIDFLSQLLIVAIGFVLVLSPDVLLRNLEFFGEAPTLSQFLLAIPIGTIAYTGIETISNMAGEARDQDRTIPASIKRVMFAVFAIYFTLPLVALSALPVTCDAAGECNTLLGVAAEDGGFAQDPIVGIVKQMDLGGMQAFAEAYVGVLAVTILVAATNAGVLGVSRLTYSMGMHRQLPDKVRQLHPRFQTPYIGILVFSAFAVVAILPGQADFLGSIYAFGAMLSFSMAHLAVIRLRTKDPDHRRPYRSPGKLSIAGRDLPPFAVIGLLGTGLSFVVVTALDLTVGAAGFVWLALGITVYVIYRRHLGLDLTTTVVVATPKPVTEREAEYASVLVVFEGGAYDEAAVATAVKLAARRRRGIHILVPIIVPNSAPIGAPLPDQEQAAQSIIERAKIKGGRRVSGHTEKVRAGQAGRLIVNEAREMRAAAIVMPIVRRRGAVLFGPTLETVLTERPCRVILESTPVDDDPQVRRRQAAKV